jgi:hypothetical protein
MVKPVGLCRAAHVRCCDNNSCCFPSLRPACHAVTSTEANSARMLYMPLAPAVKQPPAMLMESLQCALHSSSPAAIIIRIPKLLAQPYGCAHTLTQGMLQSKRTLNHLTELLGHSCCPTRRLQQCHARLPWHAPLYAWPQSNWFGLHSCSCVEPAAALAVCSKHPCSCAPPS